MFSEYITPFLQYIYSERPSCYLPPLLFRPHTVSCSVLPGQLGQLSTNHVHHHDVVKQFWFSPILLSIIFLALASIIRSSNFKARLNNVMPLYVMGIKLSFPFHKGTITPLPHSPATCSADCFGQSAYLYLSCRVYYVSYLVRLPVLGEGVCNHQLIFGEHLHQLLSSVFSVPRPFFPTVSTFLQNNTLFLANCT